MYAHRSHWDMDKIPEPSQPTIAGYCKDCLESLERCFSQAFDHSREQSMIEDRVAMFSTWTVSTEVFSHRHASMDYRLRYAQDVRDVILGLLESLNRLIHDCHSALAALHESTTTEPYESRDQDLEQIFDDVSAEIDNLSKMTNSINRAKLNSQKLEKIDDGDDGDDVEASLFDQFVRHVNDRFPDASGILQQRLARTMLIRRRRFLYRRHREAESAMLDLLTISESRPMPPGAVKNDASIKTEPQGVDRNFSIIPATIPVATKSTNASPLPATFKQSAVPGSKALLPDDHHLSHSNQIARLMYDQLMLQWSAVDQVLLDDLDNTCLDNLASAGTQVRKILGTDSQAREETTCPYCLYDLPSTELFSGHKWYDHFMEDLDPHVCLFEDCLQPDELYSQSEDWLAHSHGHRQFWQCSSHRELGPFSAREHYIHHMREDHGMKLSDAKLRVLAKRNVHRLEKLFPSCPLCGRDDAEVLDHLTEHITEHLRSLAFRSLPGSQSRTDARQSAVRKSKSLVQPHQLLSCDQCRKCKRKCDRARPCSACCARGFPEECHYRAELGSIQQSLELRRLRVENQRLKERLLTDKPSILEDSETKEGSMHAFGPRRNATSGPIEFSLELRDLRAENQRLKQYLFSAEPSAPEESETEKGFTKTLGSDGSSGKFAARSVAMEDDPDNEDIPNVRPTLQWKDGIAYLHFGEVQTTPDPAAVEEMEGLSNNFAGEASHWRASGVMSGRRTSNHPLLTWHGLIQDSVDALVVFEACLSGTLQHILRRPYDHERASLIRSGSVFVYAEDTAGIRRWTDGIAWSPSRIIGNFLIYRELEKPQPSSEKKPTIKRKRSSQERSVQATEGYQDSKEVDTSGYHRLPPIPPLPMSPLNSKSSVPGMTDSDDKEKRQLVGPLVDSYGFKLDGLIKKTMSITFEGASHHLVSYYTVEDVKQRKLLRPSNDIRLNGIAIRPELYIKQNFRTPVEEQDQFAVDYSGHAYPQWSGNSDMAVLSGYRMRQSNVVPGYPPMYTTGIHLNDTAIHPELYLKHTFRAPEVESHAQQHESVDERGGPSNNTTMKIYNRDESD